MWEFHVVGLCGGAMWWVVFLCIFGCLFVGWEGGTIVDNWIEVAFKWLSGIFICDPLNVVVVHLLLLVWGLEGWLEIGESSKISLQMHRRDFCVRNGHVCGVVGRNSEVYLILFWHLWIFVNWNFISYECWWDLATFNIINIIDYYALGE